MTDGITLSGSITASVAVISVILGWLGNLFWGKYREYRARVQGRITVDLASSYVTCEQCAEHRRAIDRRIDEVSPALLAISQQITRNEAAAEQRAVDLHRRLDPIVEVTAATKFGLGQHLEDHRTSKQPSTLHR